MQKTGPIIVIEDDLEDQELLDETFKTLSYPNKILFFADGYEALQSLSKVM